LAVVDRALLRRALEILQRAGQRVVQATPQPLALGMTWANWRVRVRGERGGVRTGPHTGASLGQGAPPLELKLLLTQAARRPAAIEVDGECDPAVWSEALGLPVLAAAVDAVAPPIALDLMQYQFAGSVVAWQAWRASAALAATLLLVGIGGLNVHAWLLNVQAKAVRSDMVKLVKEVNPQVTVVLDPAAQMRRYVSDLRAGAGTETDAFLRLARGVATFAAPDSVQGMEYRGGQLSVRLRAPLEQGDAQRQALLERSAAAGMRVRIEGDMLHVSSKDVP
jgi:type II secretion system protein L